MHMVVARTPSGASLAASFNWKNGNGWGTWIRTKTSGVRVRCSTLKLFPSREAVIRARALNTDRSGGRKRHFDREAVPEPTIWTGDVVSALARSGDLALCPDMETGVALFSNALPRCGRL